MSVKYYNPINEIEIDPRLVDTMPGYSEYIKVKNKKREVDYIFYYPNQEFFLIEKESISSDKSFYVFTRETIKSLTLVDIVDKIEKDVIGSALFGGMFFGEIGAIACGMDAMKDRYNYSQKVIINDRFEYIIEEEEYRKIGNFLEDIFQKISAKTKSKDQLIEILKKLKELLDLGIITQEEFEKKKKEIFEKI